jgi:predicted nucleic acid-binding protein
MKALFDTNILIDYLNGVDLARDEFERYAERLISVVTWMEVLAGPRDAAEEDVLETFVRDFRVVELTRPVARGAIDLRRRRRIRLPEAIVWASARAESALLVTRNTKDFPRSDPGADAVRALTGAGSSPGL